MGFVASFGILFLVIVLISLIVKLLKQPIIIGYVLSGILFSVFLLKDAGYGEQVITLSELGITFLLFLMGLEFDLKSLRFLGKDILVACFLQSAVFFGAAYGLSSLFGFSVIEKVYLSVLFMFGSTLLVAKWVEDKKESATLHGKIILGTLIIQDILAIFTLTILSVIKADSLMKIVMAPVGGVALLLIAYVLSKFLLNPLLKFSSRYPELLFILSLGVCFLFVEIAPLLGYSTTLGAFIAGITLANTIYRAEVSGKLKPLINFFNMLFFVGLGFQMDFSLGHNLLLYMGLSVLLCFVLKPIVTYATLRLRGYDIRTSFLSGIYLAQLSEFGIIIVAGGVLMGDISQSISSIAIISVIVTMILSSYLIKYDKQIYAWCEKMLRGIDRWLIQKDVNIEQTGIDSNIILFGYSELNKELGQRLESLGKKMIVVEVDPENIDLLKKTGIRFIYGTPSDPEFFEHYKFSNAELVVSSIGDVQINKDLIKEFKKLNKNTTIIATARTLKASIELYDNDADYVIYQTYLYEQQVSTLIADYAEDIGKIITKKVTDIVRLKEKDKHLKQIHEENGRFIDIDSFLGTLTHGKDKRETGETKKQNP